MNPLGCVKVCNCNYSMSNTGTDCSPLIQVTKKLMMMQIFDSTGVRNYINLATSITATTFSDAINNVDPSKRLFPLPELKDIKDTRGTPIVQKFADSSTIYVRDEIRSFDGMIPGRDGNPVLKGKIEAARCGEMGVYIVDRLGNLVGVISDDGTKLYPIRLDSESVSAQYIKATDTTVQALQLTFNFHPDESDSCLRMVVAAEMGTADLLTLKGLISVFPKFSDPATTGVTLKLITEYGTPINPTTVKGLVSADFISSVGGATSKVRDTTTNLDKAVVATEDTIANPGTYDLAYTVASGDIVVVKIKKDGFDFSAVEAAPVTTP